MSNFTTVSTLFAVVVIAASVALSSMMWRASKELGNRRLRYLALGFAIFAAKHAFSIYTIQVPGWHHEVTEMVGTAFDVLVVACLAAPLFIRES